MKIKELLLRRDGDEPLPGIVKDTGAWFGSLGVRLLMTLCFAIAIVPVSMVAFVWILFGTYRVTFNDKKFQLNR